MRDFETITQTITETRPVITHRVPRPDVSQPLDQRLEHASYVADIAEWYIRHDPETAVAAGGLTDIIKKVKEDTSWEAPEVYSAMRQIPGIVLNPLKHTVEIAEEVEV